MAPLTTTVYIPKNLPDRTEVLLGSEKAREKLRSDVCFLFYGPEDLTVQSTF